MVQSTVLSSDVLFPERVFDKDTPSTAPTSTNTLLSCFSWEKYFLLLGLLKGYMATEMGLAASLILCGDASPFVALWY